jgi:hypothetical protein
VHRTEAQTARVTRSLLAVVLSPRCHPADWYGASEAAIATIYALHPRPGNLCAAMVDALAERALGAHCCSAISLASASATACVISCIEISKKALLCILHVFHRPQTFVAAVLAAIGLWRSAPLSAQFDAIAPVWFQE